MDGWVTYYPEGSDDKDDEDLVDPIVFVWRKFWTDRKNIKIAIDCSPRNKQKSYEGVKKMVEQMVEQQMMQEATKNFFNNVNQFFK